MVLDSTVLSLDACVKLIVTAARARCGLSAARAASSAAKAGPAPRG
jgi:hypothetical protein